MYCQPTNKTEAGVAQQEKMKNINVLKCLYVDAMSMENKPQALEEILNNEVYELVGTAEAKVGWFLSILRMSTKKETVCIERQRCGGRMQLCLLTGAVHAMGSNDVLFSRRSL